MPPFTKTLPSCSAFKAVFKTVKNNAPKGATIAMKQVIQKRWI